jgi:hypothetical protein
MITDGLTDRLKSPQQCLLSESAAYQPIAVINVHQRKAEPSLLWVREGAAEGVGMDITGVPSAGPPKGEPAGFIWTVDRYVASGIVTTAIKYKLGVLVAACNRNSSTVVIDNHLAKVGIDQACFALEPLFPLVTRFSLLTFGTLSPRLALGSRLTPRQPQTQQRH